ncbi:MAG: epoxyqueuosine reductase QueH [Lachnospiraceae bacterium]|nr:epoxyqueuosine reductase QueH [Lachnospiraceae bacterium]
MNDPALLLHSCCAPCSSYCLISLLEHYDITCFYYNPNITDRSEYDKRAAELLRLINILNEEYSAFCENHAIKLIIGDFEPDLFVRNVEEGGLADCPEGGDRCTMCFNMRLRKTYELACSGGYDLFTTTLTISPHKNAKLINSIGTAIAGEREGGPEWMYSDFKKKDGFKKSIELSAKYNLYRQNFCGCEYSKIDLARD